MKRRLFQIGLLLALGAMLNVVITWSCLLWPRRHPTGRPNRHPPTEAEMAWWRDNAPSGMSEPFEVSDESGFAYEARGYAAHGVVGTWRSQTNELMGGSSMIAAGFPLRGLACQWHVVPNMQASGWDQTFRWAMRLEELDPACSNRLPYLPLRPLWPGFAVNTLFYAGICWLVFAGPFAMRRRRRIKRGLCPHCAYRVGTSPVCTECGRPVTPRSVEVMT